MRETRIHPYSYNLPAENPYRMMKILTVCSTDKTFHSVGKRHFAFRLCEAGELTTEDTVVTEKAFHSVLETTLYFSPL